MSEIVGDVLLVSIAVVMVTALALQLGSVEQPSERPMATLSATYDGANITVRHEGGDQLRNLSTMFYVFENYTLKANLHVSDGRPGDDALGIGEDWVYAFPTNVTEKVRLQIIDTTSRSVVFDQILQRGPELAALPDLGLASSDIRLLRNGTDIDETSNTPMTGENLTVNFTVHNYGGTGVPSVIVRVTDYSVLDRATYDVGNVTIPWMNASGEENLSLIYHLPNGSWGIHTLSVKVVPLYNESHFANNYASKSYRVGYPVIASSPTRPYLRIRAIEFSDEHPVHGTNIIITAKISNQGGVAAYATVTYYDNTKGNLLGSDTGLGIPVGGESYSNIFWRTGRGGVHDIIVNVTDPNGTGDEQIRQIEILPTILLVDDDRAGEGSSRDVVTSMKAALDSTGATYIPHVVPGGDGPLYDGGEHPLRDYDLVVWLTGHESANTLTANDQVNLGKYLDADGRLWLIGQDIMSDLGLGNAFLGNYMKVDPATPAPWLDAGTPDPIAGVEILAGSRLNFSSTFPPGLSNRGDFVQPAAEAAKALVEYTLPNRPLGILVNDTTLGVPGTDTYASALFSFELSRMKRLNDVSLITYAMLEWFECAARWGRDLSISDQEFNITTPSFMDEVNITVWVRNNGLDPEPPDLLSPILQLGFYVDGRTFDPVRITVDDLGNITEFDQPLSEIWIPHSSPDPSLDIPARGGYLKVSMVWVANKVGLHTVTVKVDPYDYIEEINEFNNKVSSSVASETIFVRYGTLVVDDDFSANNGGGMYNASRNVSRALEDLGYDFDLFEVMGAGANGPDVGKLEQYNAIIWCSGQMANALTATDKTNLQAFLKRGDGRYLWLAGQDAVLPGIYSDGSDTFYRDFLRAARVVDPSAPKTPSYIEGPGGDPVSHGMRYPVTPTFADGGGLLVPYLDGQGMLYQSPMPTISTPNEVIYCDAEDGATEGWYARIVPVGTTAVMGNAADPARGSRVITLERTGANVQDTAFLLGDHGPSLDLNPSDLPWGETDRLTASWAFSFPLDYTFGVHVTDSTSTRRTIYYSGADADTPGADPEFGLGSWTCDGAWHSVTRDLVLDLRQGTGNGALSITRVDGFEAWMNEGSGKVDDLVLSRPFNSIRHENATFNFKTIFTSWDPSFVSYTGNGNYSAELTYLVMRWFDMYDERVELRITHLDLFYSNLTPVRDMKPMIGESYVLKAIVWNPGGTRGDPVVRFTDGVTVIDSVTVSVASGGRALAEIVWTPLFAGSRTIGASVDPDGTIAEVFKFNNIAGVAVQCYFFYDDMEAGTRNWNHDATLLRINGETKLEYLDRGVVNSPMVGSWEELHGINQTSTDYRSYNSSFRFIAPAVEDFTYTFFLTHDPWANSFGQGFYVVAVQKEAAYIVQKFNTATLEYEIVDTATLPKGEVHIYRQQASNALYRIKSFGPLLVVVTSSEGSNVNVANHDDGLGVGCNFTVMGDLANRLAGDTHVAAVALEDNTRVTVRWHPLTLPDVRGAVMETDTSPVLNRGDRYHAYLGAGHSYALANVTSDKPIMLYRISNDNDELDNAMASTGYTYGKELYFVMYRSNGGWPWRFMVTNIEDTPAADIDIHESTAASGWGGWSLLNQAVPAHSTVVFSRNGPPGDGSLHYFRITSDKNITVIFGQEQSNAFDNNCARIENSFYVDGVWDYRAAMDQPGNFVIKTPQLYASTSSQPGNFLYNVYQDFSFGTATEIAMSPGLPVLGSANAVVQSGIRYISTVPFTAMVTRTGPLTNNQTLLDATAWVPFDHDPDGNANFTLPAGAHTFQWRTNFGGAGSMKIVKFTTQKGGEIAWQLWPNIGDDPATGWNEATSRETDGHIWTFTATNRFLYLVGGSGNCWIHTILPFEGAVGTPGMMRGAMDDGRAGADGARGAIRGGEGSGEGGAAGRADEDCWAVTQPFSLVGYSSAELSFYQKYALQVGSNGVVILVGNDTAGDGNYKYRYVTPKRPYTGNLRFDISGSRIADDHGREMRWCFNGISTNGLGRWDYITVDLSPFIGQVHVKVKFLYINATMTRLGYWYIDDVTVRASRSNSVAVSGAVSDQWEMVARGSALSGTDTADAFSGDHAWLCHDPSAGVDYLKGGIDSSLTSVPIDLTNALDAYLDCRFKFNINATDGRPPDGFRVEVSADNGESWQALNRGVRSSWKVSGTEAAGGDGTSATGVNIRDNWVGSLTLSRLNCDLSGYAGSVILLRFRVVTRDDLATHYDSAGAGFGGLCIDDVKVVGNTTSAGRSAADPAPAPGVHREGGGPEAPTDGGEQGSTGPRGPSGAGVVMDGPEKVRQARARTERAASTREVRYE